MSIHKRTVLDVGQCDFDHGNISRMLTEEYDADVKRAATSEEACRAVQNENFDLVLVNRILDADGASGLDLIQQLLSKEAAPATRVMLVSNYTEAQDSAVALGATRGFGKDALTNSQTRDLLTSLFD